jgi:hypothetical protein
MKTITIMCDYYADGLWVNGEGIEAEDLYCLKSLSNKFDK